MTSSLKKQFSAKLAALLDEIERAESAAIKRALALLEDVRTEIIARIAEGGSQFNLSVYRQVQNGIDAAIREFERALSLQLSDGAAEFETLGNRLISEPVRVVTTAPISISGSIAQVVSGYSADLVRGLSSDVRSSVNSILRRILLGAITPDDAIKEIGRDLKSGVFRNASARAESIVRTEVLRVQSIASHARMKASREAMRAVGWDLGRRWLTANDKRVRLSHKLVNGQERALDVEFELPIIYAGQVVGYEKLLYPRDPNASAANSINCRCFAIPKLIRLASSQSLDRTSIAA